MYMLEKRLPFVRFEDKENGINLEASAISGRPIPKVTTMIILTQHGSKDEFEAVAVEWLAAKRNLANRGEYDLQWVESFERQYKAWREGHELPREGTPVMTWPAVSKEQSVRLRALGFTVIEDVAQVPDSGLAIIGLDGRYLRDLARNWINESKDKGITSKELADANAKLSDQAILIAKMQEQIAELAANQKQKPGRKPMDEAA